MKGLAAQWKKAENLEIGTTIPAAEKEKKLKNGMVSSSLLFISFFRGNISTEENYYFGSVRLG